MLKKPRRYRPTSLLVGASLCLSAVLATPVPAAAAACQAGNAGCVLPVGNAPEPVPVQTSRPPVIVDVDEGGGGIGWLPILLGLAALAALYFFVIDDDEEVSP